jgi:hypothetical protein
MNGPTPCWKAWNVATKLISRYQYACTHPRSLPSAVVPCNDLPTDPNGVPNAIENVITRYLPLTHQNGLSKYVNLRTNLEQNNVQGQKLLSDIELTLCDSDVCEEGIR